jgi:site-specific DNA-methyltransferase (adenine-specific)
MINLLHGDCLEQMKTLDDNSVDSIVSDPPYGISFMAKKWDYDVPSVEVWKEAMRVLKPGGHALIACGTRTQHRMVVNIEDAGFEIRDVVSWIYGSGFPKSLNISKAIDKAAGAEREVVGVNPYKNIRGAQADDETQSGGKKYRFKDDMTVTAPATEAAKQWDGWGTALKPSCEFFTLCRKPLSESTIAKNVLKWGTGGINIDGCRVEGKPRTTHKDGNFSSIGKRDETMFNMGDKHKCEEPQGRFPANLIHDGSQEVLDLFPETKPSKANPRNNKPSENMAMSGANLGHISHGHSDNGGSAARFFYCAKASKRDRDEGNNHPTVKPTALMQYLCRLITPAGGTVLDPYMGSGSTGKAALREGFSFVGCELDKDYYEIAKARVGS